MMQSNMLEALLRNILFHLFIAKPFDPLQLSFLVMCIAASVYIVKRKGVLRIFGIVLLIASLIVIAVRVLVVLYLAVQCC